MPAPKRLRAPAGLSRAGVLALALLLSPSVTAAAEAWYRSYAAAQQHLLEDDAPAAEAALLEALADRPLPGCRLRTYGVRVRDYTPWYYLGVSLHAQGRRAAALEALERSVAEGVIQDCPGTRLQALDLLDRLDRLDAGEPSTGVRSGAASRLRAAALEAGASRFAPAEVAQAEAEDRRCGDCPSAVAAWSDALSRARVGGPILLLLERSAREAVSTAELALSRRQSPDPRTVARLGRARAGLERAGGPADWLAAEREAEQVLAELAPEATGGDQALPPPSASLAVALDEAIRRAEASSPSGAPIGGGAEAAERVAAERDLQQARELARSTSPQAHEEGLRLAERARSMLARARPAEPAPRRPALIEWVWSESARVKRPALLPSGEEP